MFLKQSCLYSFTFIMLVSVSSIFSMKSASSEKEQKAEDTLIKLRSAKEIKESLCKAGFDHFVKVTNIHQRLGDQETYLVGVKVCLDLALEEYKLHFKDPIGKKEAVTMRAYKDHIVKAILHNAKTIRQFQALGY